ncbi:uncharacterized protein SPPG_00053 [Spizellomyces punctatus DAOM BR117]|uniref:Uncharacterized protein n=1 Tax=Spizellomyces punctatus (strain DAOM BR117) TaxID=645134 RepID=A0A0L0HT90_SPIPD|nr:uncharacterized protein SPPG_00053 [Spizellomyces punctatus DAOM BR117]KND04322.1 hypothetical protein SPPG_00053 [Spizellomyces punctatus DAOM BR117]|eukprot:XP_016612361.1 hypothetical protein SPPG_00053 [Spizellomyces punctatus DAOM BR117]
MLSRRSTCLALLTGRFCHLQPAISKRHLHSSTEEDGERIPVKRVYTRKKAGVMDARMAEAIFYSQHRPVPLGPAGNANVMGLVKDVWRKETGVPKKEMKLRSAESNSGERHDLRFVTSRIPQSIEKPTSLITPSPRFPLSELDPISHHSVVEYIYHTVPNILEPVMESYIGGRKKWRCRHAVHTSVEGQVQFDKQPSAHRDRRLGRSRRKPKR